MAPVRVLSVGNVYPPHDFGGGYERVWVGANAHLRARGHRVRVLCSDHRVDGVEHETDPDVHRDLRWYWREHGFPRTSLLAAARLERHNAAALDRHLEEFEPDLVLWWSMGGMSIGLLETARRHGLPALALVHDDWLDYGRRADAWQRRGSRLPTSLARASGAAVGAPMICDFDRAARYLFVSRHTMGRARSTGLRLPEAGVLHSGIDPALLEAPAEAGWRWRLLCLGRIDERKGTATAIEALPHLPAQARLTVVGDGDPAAIAALRERAERLGVADRVELAGRHAAERVRDAYDACDAVVFPVVWEEPWGLVPLEAMARQRPVVATGRGGSGEYLRDGRNCLLFEAADAEALAASVRRLGADPDLRARLGEEGRRIAAEHTEEAFNDRLLREAEARAGS